jgi:hypothetical protein
MIHTRDNSMIEHVKHCENARAMNWSQERMRKLISNTHAKISHLVTSLSTSRQQVVFALLVTSCQQVWNKLLTICNNLVDIIRLACCKVVPTSPIQSWYNNIVTTLCRQPCNILVYIISWLHVSDLLEQVQTC